MPEEPIILSKADGRTPAQLLSFPRFYGINKVDIYTEISRKERTDGTYDERKSYAAGTDKRVKK